METNRKAFCLEPTGLKMKTDQQQAHQAPAGFTGLKMETNKQQSCQAPTGKKLKTNEQVPRRAPTGLEMKKKKTK